MKKAERIAALVTQLGTTSQQELDPRYLGFFQCFNQQRYYEAHDLLEDLWLELRNSPHPQNSRFLKGLIQLAGAFVHLQKQRLRPEHPKDGRRTRPAARLFGLAANNLAEYRPVHMDLDVEALCIFCLKMKVTIEETGENPWQPTSPPQVEGCGGGCANRLFCFSMRQPN